MKTKNILTLFSLILLLYLGASFGAAPVYAAPSITFSPTSFVLQPNQTTQVTLNLNTDGTSIFGVDAVINYPTSLLEIVTVGNGSFFTDFSFGNNAAIGKLEVHGYFASLFQTKSGSGSLTTVTVKGKGTGSGNLTFSCGGTGTTTQMLDGNGTNILSCTALNTSVVTVSTSITPSNTPIPPTPTTPPIIPTNTPPGTPTPTNIPGNKPPVCSSLTASPTTGRAPIWIKLSCTGFDPNNDLGAAEFIFGDGTKQYVPKKVGSSGTIYVEHGYSIPGSYNAYCRLQDNNSLYSDNYCSNILKIDPPMDQGQTGIIRTSRPTATPTIVILADNSVQDVDLEPYITITPTPEVLEITPTPEPESGFNFGKILLWVVIIGVILLVLYLIYRALPAPPPPPPGDQTLRPV